MNVGNATQNFEQEQEYNGPDEYEPHCKNAIVAGGSREAKDDHNDADRFEIKQHPMEVLIDTCKKDT